MLHAAVNAIGETKCGQVTSYVTDKKAELIATDPRNGAYTVSPICKIMSVNPRRQVS